MQDLQGVMTLMSHWNQSAVGTLRTLTAETEKLAQTKFATRAFPELKVGQVCTFFIEVCHVQDTPSAGNWG
jgi:hypothetical protein